MSVSTETLIVSSAYQSVSHKQTHLSIFITSTHGRAFIMGLNKHKELRTKIYFSRFLSCKHTHRHTCMHLPNTIDIQVSSWLHSCQKLPTPFSTLPISGQKALTQVDQDHKTPLTEIDFYHLLCFSLFLFFLIFHSLFSPNI